MTASTPSILKTVVGLVGSLLTFVLPLLASVEDWLPQPWPVVIGIVLSIGTALGIYHAPYAPSVPSPAEEPVAPTPVVPPAVQGPWRNPYKQ